MPPQRERVGRAKWAKLLLRPLPDEWDEWLVRMLAPAWDDAWPTLACEAEGPAPRLTAQPHAPNP